MMFFYQLDNRRCCIDLYKVIAVSEQEHGRLTVYAEGNVILFVPGNESVFFWQELEKIKERNDIASQQFEDEDEFV